MAIKTLYGHSNNQNVMCCTNQASEVVIDSVHKIILVLNDG